MGGDPQARLLRRLASRDHFLVGVENVLRRSGLERILARNHQLERLDALRRAIGDKGAHRFGAPPVEHIAGFDPFLAFRAALQRGGHQPRAGGFAGRNGAGQFRFDLVAQRAGRIEAGIAMVEQHASIAPGGDLQFLGRQDELVIDFLDRAAPGQMGMGVDHAGHQRRALAVDHHVGLGRIDRRLVAQNVGDAIALDHDRAGEGRTAGPVENRNIADQLPHEGSPLVSC